MEGILVILLVVGGLVYLIYTAGQGRAYRRGKQVGSRKGFAAGKRVGSRKGYAAGRRRRRW
jgi:hypothetical protein